MKRRLPRFLPYLLALLGALGWSAFAREAAHAGGPERTHVVALELLGLDGAHAWLGLDSAAVMPVAEHAPAPAVPAAVCAG